MNEWVQLKSLPTPLLKYIRNWLSASGRSSWRRFSGPIFLIAGVMAVLAILVLDGQKVMAYTFQLNPVLVLLSVVTEFSGLVLAVPAWHSILARFGSRLGYQDDLRIYCYTLLGIAIPGGFWSLVGRVTLYERQGVPGIWVTTATVVEFILVGLAGLAVYGLTTLVRPAETLWQQPAMAVGITVLALILVQPPIFNRIITLILRRSGRPHEGVALFRYRDIGTLLVLEILTVIVGGTAVYFLLQSFIIIPASWYVTVVGAWAAGVAAGNLLFWFPGKPILRDGATALALAQVLPPTLAVVFVIILRLWTVASVIMAAGLAWLFLKRRITDIV